MSSWRFWFGIGGVVVVTAALFLCIWLTCSIRTWRSRKGTPIDRNFFWGDSGGLDDPDSPLSAMEMRDRTRGFANMHELGSKRMSMARAPSLSRISECGETNMTASHLTEMTSEPSTYMLSTHDSRISERIAQSSMVPSSFLMSTTNGHNNALFEENTPSRGVISGIRHSVPTKTYVNAHYNQYSDEPLDPPLSPA